jgi:hypothetical protein
VKLMLEESFHDSIYGKTLEDAIILVLEQKRTKDIFPEKNSSSSLKIVNTTEMGNAIGEAFISLLKK